MLVLISGEMILYPAYAAAVASDTDMNIARLMGPKASPEPVCTDSTAAAMASTGPAGVHAALGKVCDS